MVMIVVWAVFIAAMLLLEFFTADFYAICLAAGAAITEILALCRVSVAWQIPVFIFVSILALIIARPLLKKYLIKQTIPTNFDQNLGKQVKLLADVVDGKSRVQINDVVWTAVCEQALKKGDLVIIDHTEGNKIIVKGAK